MAKFYGVVGFVTTEETTPGVYTPVEIERTYFGDILNNYSSRWEQKGQANDDLNFSQRISIVLDPYAQEHYSEIKYIVYMGAKWKVTNVEVQWPRLVLSMGTLYNS